MGSVSVVQNVSDIVIVKSRLELVTIRYGELYFQVLKKGEDK